MNGDTMEDEEFSFDVKVAMTIYVTAANEDEARKKAEEAFGKNKHCYLEDDIYLDDDGTTFLSGAFTSHGLWEDDG
jgi:hypothetical protein